MIELLLVIVFFWFFFKGLRILFSLTWGIVKIAAAALLTLATALLVLFLTIAGGALLLIPIGLAALTFGILKHI